MKAMFKHRGKADTILGKKHINNYEGHKKTLCRKKQLIVL